jgi:hypothetical protein
MGSLREDKLHDISSARVTDPLSVICQPDLYINQGTTPLYALLTTTYPCSAALILKNTLNLKLCYFNILSTQK